MSSNNAPGETRTPNLLIRSQSRLGYSGLRKALQGWECASGNPTHWWETPTDSHNNSHNSDWKIPDPFASPNIFLIWKVAA